MIVEVIVNNIIYQDLPLLIHVHVHIGCVYYLLIHV